MIRADASEPRSFSLALCGDVLLNTRPSVCGEGRVLDAIQLVQNADVAYGHLEIPLHDFDDPGIFPSAEGALSWMRAPTWVAEELRWCGFDLISMASNHALDYSYGGLFSTTAALRRVGIAFAGAGADLGEASAPAFHDCAHGRIGLVSAVSSFPMFARAGDARRDMVGRPGVNALRYRHVLDPARGTALARIFSELGFWVTTMGSQFAVNPPGMHNSILRFEIDPDRTGVSSRCDEDDLAGIGASIRYARSGSDVVIAHLHCHEWEPSTSDMAHSPAFAVEFAKRAVAEGATVVVVQGSHAPMRGIEVIDGVPVLYDPGPLFRLGRRDRQPQDFYERWGNPPELRHSGAGILEAFQSREGALGGPGEERAVRSPLAGISHHPGFVIPRCQVDATTFAISKIELHPAQWAKRPKGVAGFPQLVEGSTADAILHRVADLSAPYKTSVTVQDGIGLIAVQS